MPKKIGKVANEFDLEDESDARVTFFLSNKHGNAVERITKVLKKVNTINIRKTLMAKCSNMQNHDYLFLRRKDNMRLYNQVHKILS